MDARSGQYQPRPHRTRRRVLWLLEQNAHVIPVFITYVLLLLSRLIEAALLKPENEAIGVVMLQLLIFLLPALVICRLRGNAFTARLRLRLPRPSHILLLLSALLALIAGSLLISIQTGGIHTLDHRFSLYDTFVSQQGDGAGDVVQLVLAYAVMPAVCEEFLFRGVLCAELEHRGLLCAVTFNALYFGMLHFQLQQLPVYMFAGVLLCLVLYATRSLPAAMLLHFAYNLFGLFGQPALTQFYQYTGSTALFTFLLTVILLLSAVLFCGEAGRIYRGYARASVSTPYRVSIPRAELPSLLLQTLLSPVGVACIVLYLAACIFG